MGLDERLLNNDNSSDTAKAGDLRAAQRSGEEMNNSDGEEPQTLRETVRASLKQRAKAAGKEGAVTSVLADSMRKGTDKLLRQSWLNLIDSFGLTLIWINIHVFLRYVLGENLFCKLGQEWTDMLPAGGAAVAKTKSIKKMTGLAESMGLVALDFMVFMIILIVFGIIYLLVTANPILLFFKMGASVIWGALTGGK